MMLDRPSCDGRACAHPTATRLLRRERDVVLLLHGSAGSSAMWRRLQEKLAPVYEAVAPDLIGYGRAEPWHDPGGPTLDDEARRVEDAIPCCDGDFHVVGYSYGGAVALSLALRNPRRVKSLTLIEPVIFGALKRWGDDESLAILENLRARFAAGIRERGDTRAAMETFLEFWTPGAWSRMPEKHRESALLSASKVLHDWNAAFAFDPAPRQLASIAPQTLLVRGDRSPQPMIRLVDALHHLLPGSRMSVVPGAGHLLPITHERALLEALIAAFLGAQERSLR